MKYTPITFSVTPETGSYSLFSIAKVAINLTQSKGFTVFDFVVTN